MKKILINLIFALIFLVTLAEEIHSKQTTKSATSLDKIKINNKWFVDQDGRIVIFRGINAVYKQFPWVPAYGHINLKNETQLKYLKQWGFNVVRLGLMWTGLYPEKNKLNQSYVNEMTDIIKNLEKHGMYVIIDLHQDMMSSKFNAYDGVPLWILNELPNSTHQYPWPFKDKNLYFQAYLTEECSFNFQCLYDNVNHFQDYFVQYWTTVAQIYSNTSSVLGYELINEPWAGDVWHFPFYFLPGVAGGLNLMRLYDRVYPEIRKYDDKTIVFYEPVTWGVMSTKGPIGTGFNKAPGNDVSRTAFSWHYYCWIINVDRHPLVNGTYPDFIREFCDGWQLGDYFDTVEADMNKLGGSASFLTEFGDCIFSDTVTGQVNIEQCKYVLDASDQHFTSWTYWDSDFYLENFEIYEDLVDIFSRVYPMYTNGIPESLFFNSTTKFFSYTYQVNINNLKQANLTTEIFVPKFMYKKGFNVQVSEQLTWTFNEDISRIVINFDDKLIEKFFSDKDFKLDFSASVVISSN